MQSMQTPIIFSMFIFTHQRCGGFAGRFVTFITLSRDVSSFFKRGPRNKILKKQNHWAATALSLSR